MQVLLGWSRLWGQSGNGRDTHRIAASQLLQQELEGGQQGDAGSLHSFWWPVRGERAERKSCVRPKPPCPSPARPGSTPKLPRSSRGACGGGAESRGSGEAGAGQALAGHSWAKQLRQLCPLESCPQPWGHLYPSGQRCFGTVRLRLEHPPVL